MRKLVSIKLLPVCLIAVAAACSTPEQNVIATDGNAANQAAVPETANEADGNAAGAEGNAASPDGAGNVYRASGTEPFWSLTIGSQMAFDSADGPDVTVATPPPQPTRAGHRYVTPEMEVSVNEFVRCQAAGGQTYHDTVNVTIGVQSFSGCGGEATPAQ
jgi:uncharacterized membrane protein